ncbi:MAG: hypothetical protein KR126chlam2_00726 [Chlamydiae bacterium]|nr:hypothetical protein [Chlamydiota bacterium]
MNLNAPKKGPSVPILANADSRPVNNSEVSAEIVGILDRDSKKESDVAPKTGIILPSNDGSLLINISIISLVRQIVNNKYYFETERKRTLFQKVSMSLLTDFIQVSPWELIWLMTSHQDAQRIRMPMKALRDQSRKEIWT